jgi:imidazolonepropionase
MKTLIKNIKSLVQVEDKKRLAVCGEDMAKLPSIDNAYLLVNDDKIEDFGTMNRLSKRKV